MKRLILIVFTVGILTSLHAEEKKAWNATPPTAAEMREILKEQTGRFTITTVSEAFAHLPSPMVIKTDTITGQTWILHAIVEEEGLNIIWTPIVTDSR